MRQHTEAIEEFDRHEHRHDGVRVVGSLVGGLAVLRDALSTRVHDDVERKVGTDSMLLPVSRKKAERATRIEIEVYQIAESAAAVRAHRYVCTDDDWYLHWLARLRLEETQAAAAVTDRLADYSSQAPDGRRLAFTNALAKILPESSRAPLVLFRLIPLSVQLATALAFGDHAGGLQMRKQQVDYLPAITDCHQCHGKVLENGEQCRGCGNPLWKFEWLTAAD